MSMTPREIVHELNRHIIGQDDAKRAVAIALRNRWRRMQLPAELRQEVTPKNILMIGPTPGQAGQCAIPESGSDQVHRGRLCRP